MARILLGLQASVFEFSFMLLEGRTLEFRSRLLTMISSSSHAVVPPYEYFDSFKPI
jgi:hypothetical protein